MLGSLWASVEIILGSFLHNLHVPFSGTFLAALGIILMINGYKIWPDKGLFWRTALVTATMKSISPSAIIFGPMVGIFMEGVILEVAVRLFRGRWLGFVIGGALAVSWSLFQKILVMLMTYGPDFVKLYEQLYFMAARSLHIYGSAPIDLVKLIFIIDLSFGALVAGLALKVSGYQKKLLLEPGDDLAKPAQENLLETASSQQYSIPLFFLNLIILVSGLVILDDLPLSIGAILVLLYVAFNITQYARSLKRLKRPQLWIQLVALMGLSGLLLGGWESQASIMNGLETGFGMAIRALLVIFGFSALSIEVRNPLILNWFSRKGMGVAFEAISVAFEVLPRLMNAVSEKRHNWRHPFRNLNQLLGALEQLRQEHIQIQARVVIVTGNQGDGKTTLIKELIGSNELQTRSFAGFYTEGTWVDDERDHYHIVDLKTGKSTLLCERSEPVSELRAGPFNFRKEGIEHGLNILQKVKINRHTIVVIDEIGHLELHDDGWAEYIQKFIDQGQAMIWTVRPALLDSVLSKWPVQASVIKAEQGNLNQVIKSVQSSLI